MTMGRAYGIKKAIIASVAVIAVVFLINTLPDLIGKRIKTILPIEEQYIEKLLAEGIVIKDEKVYKNPYNGEFYRVALEGERVHVGMEIANVLSGTDLTAQKGELLDIEKQIELLEAGKDTTQIDTLSRLQLSVSTGDYESVHGLKGDMELQLDYLGSRSFQDVEDSKEFLASIKLRKDALKSIIDKNVRKIYSIHSGILSFQLDGLEEILTIYDLDNVTSESFSIYLISSKEGNSFKIIDSFDWVLALSVDDSVLEVGDTYEIIVKNNENIDFILTAPIIASTETTEGIIYFFKSNLFLEEIYDSRYVDAEIIKLRKKALKIPIETVISKDGTKGVLVKEFYGVARFKPINIIGEDQNYVYVEAGDSYGYLEDKDGNRKKTINIYTEVLLTPGDYTEGEILQ